ncbi:MAG: tRNA (adenosine(37)-N6)-threonylcarbamoyltransferase complex dimerization subunit type 1 TsaB [Burkholderiales bacterium]|jgi:tRNA threonylcarbamoyladenosine biosynthesis protein TsaB|nr:tRNA (adenosine(37)-N6)-threonylcarbamoyltransferase complex dimerization subunit type 1 TsaB [Burkholderiales bacterium]
MNILALETTTARLSVAVGVGLTQAAPFWVSREMNTSLSSGNILPEVAAALAEAKITLSHIHAIAVDVGPGSFTGVRVGCSVAQGLAFGLNIPVVPVSSLAAIAEAASQKHGVDRVVSVSDARMNEVYIGAFLRIRRDNNAQENRAPPLADSWREVFPPTVLPPHQAIEKIKTLKASWMGMGAGDGLDVYPEWRLAHDESPLFTEMDATCVPTARVVGELALPRGLSGDTLPADRLLPLYVRNRVALTIEERRDGARL